MQLRLDEVEIYDTYSDDPDAENSVFYASKATPVFLHLLDSGVTTLTTTPQRDEELYGHLHSFDDPDYEEGSRLIVVRAS